MLISSRTISNESVYIERNWKSAVKLYVRSKKTGFYVLRLNEHNRRNSYYISKLFNPIWQFSNNISQFSIKIVQIVRVPFQADVNVNAVKWTR